MRLPGCHWSDKRRWKGAVLAVLFLRGLVLAYRVECLVVYGCPVLVGVSVPRDRIIHIDWAGNRSVSSRSILQVADRSLYVFELGSSNRGPIKAGIHWTRFAGGDARYWNVCHLSEGVFGASLCLHFLRRPSRRNVFITFLCLCRWEGVVGKAFARDN